MQAQALGRSVTSPGRLDPSPQPFRVSSTPKGQSFRLYGLFKVFKFSQYEDNSLLHFFFYIYPRAKQVMQLWLQVKLAQEVWDQTQ